MKTIFEIIMESLDSQVVTPTPPRIAPMKVKTMHGIVMTVVPTAFIATDYFRSSAEVEPVVLIYSEEMPDETLKYHGFWSEEPMSMKHFVIGNRSRFVDFINKCYVGAEFDGSTSRYIAQYPATKHETAIKHAIHLMKHDNLVFPCPDFATEDGE